MTGDNNGVCQICGGTNPVWFVDSDRWNLAMGDKKEMIVCPGCFVKAHEQASGMHTVWKLEPSESFRYPHLDISYSTDPNGMVELAKSSIVEAPQIIAIDEWTNGHGDFGYVCECGSENRNCTSKEEARRVMDYHIKMVHLPVQIKIQYVHTESISWSCTCGAGDTDYCGSSLYGLHRRVKEKIVKGARQHNIEFHGNRAEMHSSV